MIGGRVMFFQVDFANGHVVSLPELRELYGYVPTSEGHPVQAFLGRFPEHDRGKVLARVEMVCTSPVGLYTRVDHRIERPGGNLRWPSSRVEVVAGTTGAARN